MIKRFITECRNCGRSISFYSDTCEYCGADNDLFDALHVWYAAYAAGEEDGFRGKQLIEYADDKISDIISEPQWNYDGINEPLQTNKPEVIYEKLIFSASSSLLQDRRIFPLENVNMYVVLAPVFLFLNILNTCLNPEPELFSRIRERLFFIYYIPIRMEYIRLSIDKDDPIKQFQTEFSELIDANFAVYAERFPQDSEGMDVNRIARKFIDSTNNILIDSPGAGIIDIEQTGVIAAYITDFTRKTETFSRWYGD